MEQEIEAEKEKYVILVSQSFRIRKRLEDQRKFEEELERQKEERKKQRELEKKKRQEEEEEELRKIEEKRRLRQIQREGSSKVLLSPRLNDRM